MSEKSDRISGRAKQAAGDLTGDEELEREGEVEEKSADIKDGIGDVADKAREKVDDAVDSVKRRLQG